MPACPPAVFRAVLSAQPCLFINSRFRAVPFTLAAPSSATRGLGLEGIVSKRLCSRYVSGRTRAWLKTKNPNFERWRMANYVAITHRTSALDAQLGRPAD